MTAAAAAITCRLPPGACTAAPRLPPPHKTSHPGPDNDTDLDNASVLIHELRFEHHTDSNPNECANPHSEPAPDTEADTDTAVPSLLWLR